jgi:hypothetical protein
VRVIDTRRDDAPPRLLGLPSGFRITLITGALLLGIFAVGLAVVAYLAATNHPGLPARQGTDLENQIANVFGVPRGKVDGSIVGDYLVERFYVVDVESGDHYVADLLKGRIQGLQFLPRADGSNGAILLLDLRGLQRDRALYAAYVNEVAPPEGEAGGYYLGLRVFPGMDDAFLVNYNGNIPPRHVPFRSPEGESGYDFLVTQRLLDVKGGPSAIGVDGYNYILSGTDNFPFLRNEFRIGKSVFLSELVVVDATAPQQQKAFFRLLDLYHRSTPPR